MTNMRNEPAKRATACDGSQEAMSCRPLHGLNELCLDYLGLTPQALRYRLLRRLGAGAVLE
jgi:hypothetical protein